ncbi:MAG: hypothetical protein CMJ06_00540 [Pelagibacterales bacterium]|nr:hypothetical protein [Pelagibacterales bacterium]OUU63538.1 MAG: hypothetical protein CBC22_00510 [Alphaproteobacteria bacterium TMED62]|tara:strand:+ start:1824 stop:2825 length:1002 start_codon:yes stop_codon:yes gene_type:complete
MYYKNYLCKKLGKVENLKINISKKKPLKKNQVRLKILSIGLSYVDILMIKGTYQHKNELPFIPGTEACGIIIEEKCNNAKLLNKKAIIISKKGCFSEEIIIELSKIILISNKMPSEEAASFFSSSLTSYIALKETAKIKKNDFILITGASGSIGQNSIMLASHFKLNIICIASNKKKASLLRKMGVKKVIFAEDNIKKKIMTYTKNKGVDIILDINGFLKEKNILSCLAWNGKYLIVGFTNNNISSIKTNYILIKSIQVFGIRAGEYLRRTTMSNKKKIIKDIFKLYKKKIFKVKPYKVQPFNKLIEELTIIRDRKSMGKIVINTKYLSSDSK